MNSMTRCSTALYFSMLLILSFPLSARPGQQAGSEPATPQQETVIRSSVRLVQVSVVVEDKKGDPVTGLKPEDFTVLDEGKPQKIAFFTAAVPAAAAPVPELTAKHPASLLPANAFTNRYDLKGQEPPAAVTVVLFDALNTAPQDQSYVRKEVIRFLQTLKPQDHVAVYGLTQQLFILHEFTRDASDLVAAAQRFTPQELAAFDASHTPDIDLVSLGGDPQWATLQNSLNNANAIIGDQYTKDRVGITVAAMDAIANHVSAIPGRKSLVWISGGLPIQLGAARVGTAAYGGAPGVGAPCTANCLPGGDREGVLKFDEMVREVADTLNRFNIAMYAIDAKGVELDTTMDVSQRGPRLSNQVRDTSMLSAEQDARDASKLLADRTGGLAFFGNNDVRGAIRHAFDDGRYAYNIAFYPDHGQWDGKFRKIKIQAKGEGMHLRYRSGYYASPQATDAKEEIATALQQAADSPLDATNLGMIVSGGLAGAPAKAGDARRIELHIGIDPKQLLLQNSGDHRKGAVDLFFLQRDAAGNRIAAEKQHIELNLEEKQYEYLTKAAMVLDRHLTIAPQSTEIRVVLRDTGSGSLGSVTIPTAALLASGPSVVAPARQPN